MPCIDRIDSSSDHCTDLLENEHVRIVDMKVPAGEVDNMHSNPDETVYFITGGKAKIVEENTDTMEADIPDGATMWHLAWTHQVTNTSDTEIRAIIFESKQ